MSLIKMEIRENEDIYSVLEVVFPKDYHMEGKERKNNIGKDTTTFSVHCDGVIAACATVTPTDKGFYVRNVAALPEYRRRGLAATLMNYLYKKYQNKLYGVVDATDEAALQFYDSLPHIKRYDVVYHSCE